MDNQERIDAYLRNEMNEAEQRLFESDLNSKSSLAQQYDLTKDVVSAIDDRQVKVSKLQKWETEIKNEERRVWYWVTGVGVAACLAVGLFVSMPESSDGTFVPPSFGDGEVLYRGGFTELQAIDRLIDSGEYKDALVQIESLEDAYAKSVTSLMAKEHLSEEQDYEKSLTEENLYVLIWRKINVLLALNKREEALNILRFYRYQSGTYQKDAFELWQRMDKQN